MAVTELTLDQCAAQKILTHRANVRAKLQNYINILQDVASVVKTAKCYFDGLADMYLGEMVENIVADRDKYNVLDSYFDGEYATYAASSWKTEIDASTAALTGLITWVSNRFDNNYMAVDPAGKYVVDNLTAAHKTAFANEMISVLG